MQKVLFVKPNGLISQVSLMISGFIENTTYGDTVVKIVETDLEAGNILMSKYWDFEANELASLPTRPSMRHIWNYVTAEWELPETYLDDLKTEVYTNLRDATNSKILSIYPETTQRNKQARWSELFQIQVSSPTEFTEDLSSEKQSIEAIWNWIKNIRSRYAETTDAISLAEEENTILTLSEEYKTWLSALV